MNKVGDRVRVLGSNYSVKTWEEEGRVEEDEVEGEDEDEDEHDDNGPKT